MKLEDIYRLIETPPPIYLSQEVATCYILAVLAQEKSCGTVLMQRLEKEHPPYRVSDSVLYNALKFLESEGIVQSYWKKFDGSPGRPRRMYKISPKWETQLQGIALPWQKLDSQ